MRGTITGLLACAFVLATTAASVGQSRSAIPTIDPAVDPALGREEAVARVRALDPRFADLPDHEAQRKESARSFSLAPLLASSYVRVLPTSQNDFADQGWVDFRYPAGWLIETTLVDECADVPADGTMIADPCAWRHTWVHHVTADGDVVKIYDTGDPEPMPSPEDIAS